MTIFCDAHPLVSVRRELRRAGFVTAREYRRLPDGTPVRVAGLVILVHTPPTRSGRRIMFVTLEDETGLIDLMVAPEAQKDCGWAVMTQSVVHLEGVVQRSEKGGLAITTERVVPGMPDPLEMPRKQVGLVAAARAALASKGLTGP